MSTHAPRAALCFSPWPGLLLVLLVLATPAGSEEPILPSAPPPPSSAETDQATEERFPEDPEESALLGAQADAASLGSPTLPIDRFEEEGAAIGRIRIRVADVFDENGFFGEERRNLRMHRWVNRLHRKTRDHVVERQLLFREGDPFSARLLAESERILRERNYLFDAEIVPVGARDGSVDVEVRTRDVWTLNGGVSFGREGGENEVELEIQDSNFLGTGKEVGISHRENVDRTINEVLYRDANPFGRYSEIELILADNSDGHRYLLQLDRPFYALETRWAAGLTALAEERTDRVFDRGEAINRFDLAHEVIDLHWGRSPGLIDGSIQRWRLGYTWESLDFAPFAGDSEEQVPSAPPTDRAFSQVWVGYQFLQDRFVEARELDHVARTEDIQIGPRVSTRVGYSASALGATRDLIIGGIDAAWGFQPTSRQLLFADASHGARWGSADGDENLVVSGELRYYWRNLGRHTMFARVHADWGKNLDEERPFQLGGDNGLRGYPLRYATGDRRWWLTVEQRFFTDWEPFKLARIGAAVFVDAGRAWYGDGRLEDPGLLRDVGLGLRLSPTRSGKGSVLHVDVAFPLDGDGSIDSVQWLVTSKKSL